MKLLKRIKQKISKPTKRKEVTLEQERPFFFLSLIENPVTINAKTLPQI